MAKHIDITLYAALREAHMSHEEAEEMARIRQEDEIKSGDDRDVYNLSQI